MILYRSVGLLELELIYDSGMQAFPARLPQQPIFYPVLQLEYARQIASDWNVKSGQSAGYVTQFKVEDDYIDHLEKHTVGDSQHEEFWIPAEELDAFNQHIIGHIKVVEAYFGDAFQGFVPEMYGLQGKDAVAQFTLLANSYIYKRMDFYLEIKRNHKAIFLNYPFWHRYDFKNQGLKEKVLQAIKEAWFTSFPKTPLVDPLPVDITSVKYSDPQAQEIPIQERATSATQTDSDLVNPIVRNSTLMEQTDDSYTGADPAKAGVAPGKQKDSHFLARPVHEDTLPAAQLVSHFSRGLELGLSNQYQEAIDELSKAIEEDSDHILAQTGLGVAFHRLSEDDRALSCYDAALRIDSKYAEAHYFRANILYAHGNIPEAIAGYTIAIGLKPGLINAHDEPAPQDRLTDYTLFPAQMYWIAKPAHRIIDLNKLLIGNPGQANLFKERAAEYYRLLNYEHAITDYNSYLAIQQDDANAFHFRGLAYEQLGQFDRALEDYQQAIAIDPQLSSTYINRGITFGKMGNFRQSIASLTEGIRLDPQNPDGYFNRGMTYFQQGDLNSAIDDFSNVIRLSPGEEDAYYWRGVSYEEVGKQREAAIDYRQFLKLSQNPRASDEIEQKLRRWNEGKRNRASSRTATANEMQATDQIDSGKRDQGPDLYELIVALGERALNSTWLGRGVHCYGEKAEELHAFTDHNRTISGSDLLHITSGIRQTMEGDFEAFDPDSTSHWIFIRAWDGSGFYIEINDTQNKESLKTHFQGIEEVQGASAPYASLFIRT